jgi:ABC-type transport system substrate-binding protein
MELDRTRVSRMTLAIAVFAAVLMLGTPTIPIGQNGIDLGSVGNASAGGPGDRTLRLGWTVLMDQIETLNPYTYTWGAEYMAIWSCYSTLVTYDVDQKVTGDLAINWTSSPDGKTWTFKIAKNAVFYNKNIPSGPHVPVTSADVAFSYWLSQNNTAGLQSYFPVLPGQPGRLIESIETPNAYEIIFHLRVAYAPFFSALVTIPILPKYIWQNESYQWNNFRIKAPGALWPPIVGSGPFFYGLPALPTTGTVELLRSPTWFQSEERGYDIHVDKIIMRSETESSNYQNFVSNPINDVISNPTVEQWLNGVPPIPSGGSTDGQRWTSSQGFVWEFNMNQMTDEYRAAHSAFRQGSNNQLLLDPAVKKALQMTIDKSYIATTIFKDTAKPSDSLVPQVHPYHYVYGTDPGDVPILFNTLAARQVLYNAGWKYRAINTEILPGDSDNHTYFPLYQRVGGVATNPLAFNLITPATDSLYDPTCREIEKWAAQAGVDLIYNGPSTAAFMNNAWANADYDIWLWNWWMTPTYDISTDLMSYMTTDAIGSWSDVFWSNATYDSLYYTSLQELDPVKRKLITDELQRMAYESSGCWPVVWIDFLYAAQSITPDYWTNWGNWTQKFPLSVDASYFWLFMQIEPSGGGIANLNSNAAPKVSGVPSRYYEATLTNVDFSAVVQDESLYSALEYQWNFGDGTKSGWLTPHALGDFAASHPYAEDGYYDVHFMVREKTGLDLFGNWASSMAVITNLSNTAPKNLAFTSEPSDPDSGTIVYLNGTATDDQGDPMTYKWNFGDGTTGTGQQTTHQFTKGDPSYTVTMLVDDGHLGTGSRPVPKSNLVSVGTNHLPTCSAKDEALVTKGVSWKFTTTVSDVDTRDRLRLTWDWGDGEPVTVMNINTAVTSPTQYNAYHTYKFNGDFILKVYSDDKTGLLGHNVTDTALVHVERRGDNAPIVAAFSASTTTPSTVTLVTFSATVTDDDNELCIANFTFGDGTWQVVAQTTINSTVTATHTYTTATAYLAYADATDGQLASEQAGPEIIDVWQAVEFILELSPGWNMVTLPLVGLGYKASTLGLLNGDVVSGWNSSSKAYDKNYIIGSSPARNDFLIAESTGYWIYAGGPTTLHLYGRVPTTPQTRTITVPAVTGGWVIVGFNSLNTTRHASNIPAMYSGGVINTVAGYNTTSGLYNVYTGIPRTDFWLVPGQAYWCWCTASGVLTYNP